MKTFRVVLLAVLVAAGTRPSAQDDVFFMALPPEVLPVDVGANAFSIVGAFYSGGALRWMPTSGATGLGGVAADAISLDGKTIIGRAIDSRGAVNAALCWAARTGACWDRSVPTRSRATRH